MSGLEQRTKGRDEALAGAAAVMAVTAPPPEGASAADPQSPPVAEWPAIEGDLLDERRAAVPAFPLDLLPSPWREWVGAAAQSADAPVDYVAQALLATVAGVSSPGVWVCITRDWVEELLLWLAVVGAPSTGKSPALTSVRRLVNGLKRPPVDLNDSRPIHGVILYEDSFNGTYEALADRRHGHVLWRDGAQGCLTPLRGMSSARQFETLPVSILQSIEPDGVTQALQAGGEGLVARFLYAWPHATPFRPLGERAHPESGEVRAGLQRLLALGVRSSLNPCVLSLDEAGASAFNAFLARLHAEVREAEGLEAAWLGKGRGTVACLAATFALMSWSSTEQAEPPHLGVDAVERAVSLWSDYYRPQANAFFQSVVPTDVECQARRVVRWLRADGRSTVSRTEVRRSGLGRTVDARGAERVVSRLVEAGVLRAITSEGRGRPALRWQVNPLLAVA